MSAEPIQIAADSARPFVAAFERLKDEGSLPGDTLAWLAELRARAIARFAASGLPTRRDEAWKYTSLRRLETATPAAVAGSADLRPAFDRLPTVTADGTARHRLVFAGGRLRDDLSVRGSLPAGVQLLGLAEALARIPDALADRLGGLTALDRPIAALNTALAADGAVLWLAAGARVEEPIELVFLAPTDAADAAHARILVVAEAGSRATLVEHHVGPAATPSLSTLVTEAWVEAGAALTHVRIQQEGDAAVHLATGFARVAADGLYDGFVLTAGAGLSRAEIAVELAGRGANCRVNGAYMIAGTQHCDATTLIDHAAAGCTSREVFKGVIDNDAHGVFQGKILVRPNAQQTDGYQQNRALLLSDRAEIDSKPELEIHADDVRCSHGATVGELDEDQLFYLRARAIPEAAARALLIAAFLDDALAEIPAGPVREHCHGVVERWLAARNRQSVS